MGKYSFLKKNPQAQCASIKRMKLPCDLLGSNLSGYCDN